MTEDEAAALYFLAGVMAHDQPDELAAIVAPQEDDEWPS